MSHRTQHLPELTGLRHVLREIRYKESARQILGFVFAFAVTIVGKPVLPLAYIGVPLVVLGVAIRLWSSGHIMKNSVLATNGPYTFVRHPLYTGNILLLLGFAIAGSQLWAYVVLAIFLYVFYPTAISYEDHKLEELFGDEWRAWSQQTPALVPRKIRSGSSKSQWSFQTSMSRNAEPVIAAILLGCLIIIFVK